MEVGITVADVVLGLVHRIIRPFDEIFRNLRIEWIERYSDAPGNVDFIAQNIERLDEHVH